MFREKCLVSDCSGFDRGATSKTLRISHIGSVIAVSSLPGHRFLFSLLVFLKRGSHKQCLMHFMSTSIVGVTVCTFAGKVVAA